MSATVEAVHFPSRRGPGTLLPVALCAWGRGGEAEKVGITVGEKQWTLPCDLWAQGSGAGRPG